MCKQQNVILLSHGCPRIGKCAYLVKSYKLQLFMNNGVDGSYKIRDKLNVKKWILSFLA